MHRASLVILSMLLLPVFVPTLLAIEPAVSALEVDDIAPITGSADVPRTVSSLIGFDSLYADGFDGSGVSIVVMDSGINAMHDDLDHRLGSTDPSIVFDRSFVPGEDYTDGDGHGTFIAGMLVGNGDSSSGSIIGMVPGADIWNMKVLDSSGEGDITWTENALAWIATQPTKPDIISMSFGSIDELATVEVYVKQLWDAGVTIVVAAGNEGPEYYTINSPASTLECITVGACTTDLYILSFSSEGPTTGDNLYKPEVVAFGSDIISLDLVSGYSQGSGTSFSVPFIVAGIALMIDATNGAATPDEIKAAVMDSATSLGYSYPYMDGAGLPDFGKALDIVTDAGWDGVAFLPGDVTFPVESKDGTVNLEKYDMLVTVVSSRYNGIVTVIVEGDILDFTSATVLFNDDENGQFVVLVHVAYASFSAKNGIGVVVLKDGDGNVVASINIEVIGVTQSPLVSLVIIVISASFIVGVAVFFAVVYEKGSRGVPYMKCEIDKTCPIRRSS